MAEYLDLLPEAHDPSAIEEEIFEAIQSNWPDWEPSEGNLETWMIRAIALRISELNDTAVDVADEIFATYGAMRGVSRFNAAPAVGETTWTLIDSQGYTIPAGVELAVARSGSDLVSFTTAEEVVVPQGSATGAVSIVASEPGQDGNGLSGPVTLTDALIWVDSITLDAGTHAGVDEEELGAYLTRLKERLEVVTETPILPRDFELIARTFFTFVGRAVARDGWNPSDSSSNNERMVSVAVTDRDGETLDGGQKTQVKDLLQSMREVNFVVHVIDADYTQIDVYTDFEVMAGYDHGVVQAAVEDALTVYLSPAEWGRSQITGSAAEFVLQDKVRLYELVSLVDRVPGVDYVSEIKLAKHGQALAAADITLTGAVPLTKPGDFTWA